MRIARCTAVRCVAALGAAASALGLTACGSGSTTDGTPVPTSPSATTRVGSGSALHYSSFGTEADIDCGDRRALDVSGSNNTLTVTGDCASVIITGADNRVRLDKIADTLEVGGLNNSVVYLDGDPDVINSGTGNSIRRD